MNALSAEMENTLRSNGNLFHEQFSSKVVLNLEFEINCALRLFVSSETRASSPCPQNAATFGRGDIDGAPCGLDGGLEAEGPVDDGYVVIDGLRDHHHRDREAALLDFVRNLRRAPDGRHDSRPAV